MSEFTQYCIWFLFICVVCETAWKGYNYYQLEVEDSQIASKGVEEVGEVEEVEEVEEVCEKCGNIITEEGEVKDIKKEE